MKKYGPFPTVVVILFLVVIIAWYTAQSKQQSAQSWPKLDQALVASDKCDPDQLTAAMEQHTIEYGREVRDFGPLAAAECQLQNQVLGINQNTRAEDIQTLSQAFIAEFSAVYTGKDYGHFTATAATLDTINFWLSAVNTNQIPAEYTAEIGFVSCNGHQGELDPCNYDIKVITPDYYAVVFLPQGVVSLFYSDKVVVRACDFDGDSPYTDSNYQQLWYCPVNNINQISADGTQIRYLTIDLIEEDWIPIS